MDSQAIEPRKDSQSIGPLLLAEMTKPPYRPKVAGTVAFFFGPVAGAMVSVINLRRFGYPLKARRVFLWTLVAAAALAVVIILVPDIFGRLIGLAAEIAFYKVYARVQQKEFEEWQAAHPDIQPLNGWRALGWGFAGLFLFLAIFFLVAFTLARFFPSAP